jgi:hypothetical protein
MASGNNVWISTKAYITNLHHQLTRFDPENVSSTLLQVKDFRIFQSNTAVETWQSI